MSSFRELEECCNKHDSCYDTCNKKKKYCDDQFNKCMLDSCNELRKELREGCRGTANVMYTTTGFLGCTFYLQSQDEACECVPISEKEEL